MTKQPKTQRVLIITGLSGSGKTVALRAAEDSDFYCVDNLPVSLISSLIKKVSVQAGIRNVAVGIDIREKEFLSNADKLLDLLRSKYKVEILFLDADTDVLIRRFKETRRPHPLGGNIEESIKKEQQILSVLKNSADRIIDTTSFTPHQLRKLITSMYHTQNRNKDLTVSLLSFGFKYGVPQNIDLLFDIRFLPNPHFVPTLRDLNGTDKRVAEYVLKHPVSKNFSKKIKSLLDFLIPLYIKEGRSYLTIAIGCTGGNHRSPTVVEKISGMIRKNKIDLNVIHRDMS
ncbi:MAG: RNase adaptor protein RapZ [Nitrospirae bacterium GWC2_42_7]|nr:MAG: RNase adaptor protein RapZ [Nitrospirae bacterium GWC2_42_7]